MRKLYWLMGAFVLGLTILFAPNPSAADSISKETFDDLKGDYAYKYLVTHDYKDRWGDTYRYQYYVWTNVSLKYDSTKQTVSLPDGYTYLYQYYASAKVYSDESRMEWQYPSSSYYSSSNTSGADVVLWDEVQDFQKPPTTVKGMIVTEGKLLFQTVAKTLVDGGILSVALIIFATLLGAGLVARYLHSLRRSL